MKKSFDQLLIDAGITRTSIADAMGATTQTLRNRLKDPGQFTIREVGKIAKELNVEIPAILDVLEVK